jgi:peroxiredoxin
MMFSSPETRDQVPEAPWLAPRQRGWRLQKVRRQSIVAIAALLAMVLVLVMLTRPARDASKAVSILPGLSIGQTAPEFTLGNLAGRHVNLRDFRGRWVLLNFWGVTCAPCKSEMPALEQAFVTATRASAASKAPVILGIDGDGDSLTQLGQFVRRAGVTYPILVDSELKVVVTYHVGEIPTSVFVDPEGKIQFVHLGPLTKATIDAGLRGRFSA